MDSVHPEKAVNATWCMLGCPVLMVYLESDYSMAEMREVEEMMGNGE